MPTNAVPRLALVTLVQQRFGPHAKQIGYSRDPDGGWVTLWDVRDLGGRLIWNSMARDVEAWPDLPDVVDLLGKASPADVFGDGLRFALTTH